ncbi:MAG: ABC transporter ATP-binding protein [Cyanobacteria bacterium P01_A01_bin.135]
MTAPLLEVQNVYAGYVSGLDILQGINFRVMPGELVTVVGPNGAGKSTLAKAVFGLLTPHTGDIIFKGQSLVGLRPNEIVQRGLCYVPQLSNVFPSLTVEENLEMGGFLSQGSLADRKREILDLFPALADRQQQRAGTLSGGERQMLAMGRALMLEPSLLLLDEPSAALSPMLVSSTLEQIQRINEAGTAVVLVEQNARQGLAIAHRGVVLDQGRDRVEGPGPELLEDPEVAALYLGGRT